MQAPTRIELDEEQKVATLWVQPQIISSYRQGRPSPKRADTEEKRIPCDIVVVAIGQGIESQHFAEEGVPIRHGAIDALDHSGVENMEGIFAHSSQLLYSAFEEPTFVERQSDANAEDIFVYKGRFLSTYTNKLSADAKDGTGTRHRQDRKSTRLNSSHGYRYRMPSSA